MKTQSFIFCHNQNIIIDFKNNNKFKNLKNVKYIFLGNRDTNLIENFGDVIICRNLKYNIEEYPNLTSFSGWYAIWKNKLYSPGYLNLFEYDVNLLEDFTEMTEQAISKNCNIIGYIPFSPFDFNYLKNENWSKQLLESILKNYKVDVIEFVSNLDENYVCSMTSNHTFSSNIFEEYMLWMEPMVDDIKENYYSGHQMERSISLFYMINKIDNIHIIPDILYHFQFDSHKTQGIDQNKFVSNYNNLFL